ncbi:MAG: NEW3 domain-containing protein [Solirubrobacterales bacterium]
MALALLAAGVLAVPAGAEVRSGSAASTASPATIPDGGQDIVGLAASYDTSGTISATVTLRDAPSVADEGAIDAQFGPTTALGEQYCDSPSLIIGGLNAAGSGTWQFDPPPGPMGPATKEVMGNSVTFTASASELAYQPYFCASASTSTASGVVVVDSVDLVVPIAGPPGSARPELALEVRRKTEVERGGTAKVKVGITNAGSAPAMNIKLKAAGPPGVSVKPERVKLKRLDAGRTRTTVIKVVTGKRTAPKSKLRLKVRARGGIRAAATTTVAIGA